MVKQGGKGVKQGERGLKPEFSLGGTCSISTSSFKPEISNLAWAVSTVVFEQPNIVSVDIYLRLGPMPYIRRYGEKRMGSNPRHNWRVKSGVLHM